MERVSIWFVSLEENFDDNDLALHSIQTNLVYWIEGLSRLCATGEGHDLSNDIGHYLALFDFV
jgi:hypothetical protein